MHHTKRNVFDDHFKESVDHFSPFYFRGFIFELSIEKFSKGFKIKPEKKTNQLLMLDLLLMAQL